MEAFDSFNLSPAFTRDVLFKNATPELLRFCSTSGSRSPLLSVGSRRNLIRSGSLPSDVLALGNSTSVPASPTDWSFWLLIAEILVALGIFLEVLLVFLWTGATAKRRNVASRF